ncbi:MAG: DUF2283 domain-containing protein [Gemmatimonadota bacterium]
MQLRYYSETDTLYVAFRDGVGMESEEVGPGVVMDFDAEGEAVGLEIEEASRRVDLSTIEADSVPLEDVPAS